MRAPFCHALLMLFLLSLCHNSAALAGDVKRQFTTIRKCVHWIPRYDSEGGKGGWQFSRKRSLVYQLETKGQDRKKSNFKALWTI